MVGGECDVEGRGEGDLGGGDISLFLPRKESVGREWRGDWYYRGSCTL